MTLSRALSNLLTLADLRSDTDLVNLKLIGAWERLREQHGLCKLLLMLEEHIRNDQETPRKDQPSSPQESKSRSLETIIANDEGNTFF